MSDSEPTFSVEVLGFPPGADPEKLAESVSEFFGISIEEGRRLVVKAPLRVKRNAAPDVTQKLVRQLRKLGADVMVRNELTGEERSYRVESSTASLKLTPALLAPPKAAVPSADEPSADTLPSEDDPAPAEAAPAPNVKIVSSTGEPLAIPRPTDSSPAISLKPNPEMRASFPSDPFDPSRSGEHGASRPAISLPPASVPQGNQSATPSVPPPSAKIEFCASCTRPLDKGEVCAKCGWNNLKKERVCRQCKGKLTIVSVLTRRVWPVAAVLFVSILLASGGFLLFGPLFGAGLFTLGAALAFLADGLTLRFACKKCTVAVYSERLQKEELSRLRTARSKSLFAAAVCAAMMGGFLAFTSFAGRTLSGSSYGVAWRLDVPRLNRVLGNHVATLKMPTGSRRVRVEYAARPYTGGEVYHLAHMQYADPSSSGALDKEGLEMAMKQMVEVVYSGALAGPLEGEGDAREAGFTGTFRGRRVFGRLRGRQVENDMLFVAVTSESEDDVKAAKAREFLTSLQVDREGK